MKIRFAETLVVTALLSMISSTPTSRHLRSSPYLKCQTRSKSLALNPQMTNFLSKLATNNTPTKAQSLKKYSIESRFPIKICLNEFLSSKSSEGSWILGEKTVSLQFLPNSASVRDRKEFRSRHLDFSRFDRPSRRYLMC